MPSFKQGDIICVPFPYTDRSTRRHRPALVVSKGGVGEGNGTSAENRAWPGDVSLGDLYAEAGLPAPSVIRPCQARHDRGPPCRTAWSHRAGPSACSRQGYPRIFGFLIANSGAGRRALRRDALPYRTIDAGFRRRGHPRLRHEKKNLRRDRQRQGPRRARHHAGACQNLHEVEIVARRIHRRPPRHPRAKNPAPRKPHPASPHINPTSLAREFVPFTINFRRSGKASVAALPPACPPWSI